MAGVLFTHQIGKTQKEPTSRPNVFYYEVMDAAPPVSSLGGILATFLDESELRLFCIPKPSPFSNQVHCIDLIYQIIEQRVSDALFKLTIKGSKVFHSKAVSARRNSFGSGLRQHTYGNLCRQQKGLVKLKNHLPELDQNSLHFATVVTSTKYRSLALWQIPQFRMEAILQFFVQERVAHLTALRLERDIEHCKALVVPCKIQQGYWGEMSLSDPSKQKQHKPTNRRSV